MIWMAFEQSKCDEADCFACAVIFQSLDRIFRTTRVKPAGWYQKGRNRLLIKLNEFFQDQIEHQVSGRARVRGLLLHFKVWYEDLQDSSFKGWKGKKDHILAGDDYYVHCRADLVFDPSKNFADPSLCPVAHNSIANSFWSDNTQPQPVQVVGNIKDGAKGPHSFFLAFLQRLCKLWPRPQSLVFSKSFTAHTLDG